MTTWAYRDGILAADRLIVIHTHRDGYITKIRKRGPILAAMCGGLPAGLKFMDWFSRGLPVGQEPDMTGGNDDKYGAGGNLILPDGLILTLTSSGWSQRRAVYYANGSGQDYAYGAMAAGATAVEAVRAALQFETASGGPIDVLSHN